MAKGSLLLSDEFVSLTAEDDRIIFARLGRIYHQACENNKLSPTARATVLANASKDYRHVLTWLMEAKNAGFVFLRKPKVM